MIKPDAKANERDIEALKRLTPDKRKVRLLRWVGGTDSRRNVLAAQILVDVAGPKGMTAMVQMALAPDARPATRIRILDAIVATQCSVGEAAPELSYAISRFGAAVDNAINRVLNRPLNTIFSVYSDFYASSIGF